jgi:DNA-directed RNA polymerase specialized sigma24 family protein
MFYTELDEGLERAADDLLRKHKSLGVAHGIYRECDLRRRTAREIALGADVEFVDSSVLVSDNRPRVSLGELVELAHLTAQQRRAVRLMQRLGKQHLVAACMGINRPAVSKLLARSFVKIQQAMDVEEERLPADWARRLWHEELAYKVRLIYRKRITKWAKE